MGIKIKSNKAFFSNVSKNLENSLGDLIENTVQDISAEAAQRVPVDTGILRSSIGSEYKDLIGIAGTPIKYSPYVEFGTGGLVDVPAGLEDYAIKFEGDGIRQVDLPPRPFLYPAFKNNTTKMLKTLEKLNLNGNK